jgi:hypothetical protein
MMTRGATQFLDTTIYIKAVTRAPAPAPTFTGRSSQIGLHAGQGRNP